MQRPGRTAVPRGARAAPAGGDGRPGARPPRGPPGLAGRRAATPGRDQPRDVLRERRLKERLQLLPVATQALLDDEVLELVLPRHVRLGVDPPVSILVVDVLVDEQPKRE